MTIHTLPTRPQTAVSDAMPVMLHRDDIKTLRIALAGAPQSVRKDADRLFATMGKARKLLDASGAGVVALQPVKSLGGIG